MTHCPGYRAAAVASRTRLLSLGIDAEPHAPLPAGVLDLVADPVERAALARLARTHPGVHWDTLLFSAKESVFKAWFPLMGSWLDFTDARLHFRPGTRPSTSASGCPPRPRRRFRDKAPLCPVSRAVGASSGAFSPHRSRRYIPDPPPRGARGANCPLSRFPRPHTALLPPHHGCATFHGEGWRLVTGALKTPCRHGVSTLCTS
ncbi:4'-phosphopantetheinyl transferase family protein [Streptomyces sp. NPDC055059]|uniref:4'-phosphopantetheinyl transferase family protein n=1 Tax=Streptomyces sp. NPDC127172 TaxID=3345382 RepID=UPI00362B762F